MHALTLFLALSRFVACRCRPNVEQVDEAKFVPGRNKFFYTRLFNTKTLEVTRVGGQADTPQKPPPKPKPKPRKKKTVPPAPAPGAGGGGTTEADAATAEATVPMDVDEATAGEAEDMVDEAVETPHETSTGVSGRASEPKRVRKQKIDESMRRIESLEQHVALLSTQMMLVQDLLARVARLEAAGSRTPKEGEDPLDS